MSSKMENPDCFLLLQLPYVALREVLSSWNPFDLVNFSLVNRNTKRITKSIKKPKSHRTESRVTMTTYLALSVYSEDAKYDYQLTSDKTQHNQRDTVDHYGDVTKIIRKHSENGLQEYFEWCNYVLDVLNLNIQQVIFGTNGFRENFEKWRSIIDWIASHTKTIKLFEPYGRDDSEPVDDLISYFLSRITVTVELQLYVNLTENFQSNIPNVSERFSVHFGKWIKMEQILKIDATGIQITESEFSNQELKLFIKSWMMAESNVNLRYFRIGLQNDGFFNDIFESLKIFTPDSIALKENNIIEIGRIDGRRATVTTNDNHNILSVCIT